MMQTGEMQSIDTEIIQERNREVKKVVSQLQQLNETFCDLQHLVKEQSEIVESIETFVARTKEHTEKGEKNLKKAAASQESSTSCFLKSILGAFSGGVIATAVVLLIV